MFALSPISISSTALSVPPSVLAVPVSDLVSSRVNPVALSAPLSNSPLANDAPSNPTISLPAASTEFSVSQAGNDSGVLTGSANATGPSSAFLAQLISQSEGGDEDTQIALAASFTHFAPAPQYAALVGYSIVKYRPSDAGLPSPYVPPANTSQNDNASLVAAANDYQAYSVTQSRNLSNLAGQEPQVVVAG